MNRALIIALIVTLIATVATFEPTSANDTVICVPDDFSTINQAIQNASNGDTILVKQGMYNETIIIDKAITLKGEETNTTIIDGKNAGTVIQIFHDNVTITGFTIIYSQTPNKPHTYLTHDYPTDPPSGAIAGASSGGLTNNAVFFYRGKEWRLAGIHLNKVQDCNIVNNRITDCGVGIWLYNAQNNNITGNILEWNDYSLQVQISANNIVVGNTFQNGGGGIWFWNTNYRKEDLLKPLNYTNGVHYLNNRFYQNNFIDNIKALEKQTMTQAFQNIWDNGEKGNYWSNYNGIDSNDDGIGDSVQPIIGEYWTGTTWINGVWVDQVCGKDNYPLMTPFDTSSMFETTHENKTENIATQPTTDFTIIEATASVIGITAIIVLVIMSKKRKTAFG